MSIEGVEIRHLLRKFPVYGQDESVVKVIPVLQYRTKQFEKFEEQKRVPYGVMHSGGFREVWTEWQDVPTVTEP
jgi:hypothetical protein